MAVAQLMRSFLGLCLIMLSKALEKRLSPLLWEAQAPKPAKGLEETT